MPAPPTTRCCARPKCWRMRSRTRSRGSAARRSCSARKVGAGDQALTRLIADEVDRIAKLIDQMQTLSQPHRRAARAVQPARSRAPRQRGAGRGGGQGPAHRGGIRSLAAAGARQSRCAGAGADQPAGQRPRGLRRGGGAPGDRAHPLRQRAAAACERQAASRCGCRSSCGSATTGRGSIRRCASAFSIPSSPPRRSGRGWASRWCASWSREMNGRISHERDEARGWTHFRLHLPLANEPRAASRAGGGA